jgi:acyl-CoA synthetase (AMP-forming)/AMP-acid ligase II
MLTGEMLARSARRFASKPAIVFCGPDGTRTEQTYAQLDQAANKLANALLDLGQKFALEPGAKIAVLSRNLLEYGTIFFGVARTGYVLNNLSVLYAADELAWILEKSDTQVLLFDSQFADTVNAVLPQCQSIVQAVCINEESSAPDAGSMAALMAPFPDTAPDVTLHERDPFCMTYTGGTTGRPKGVLVDHRARAVTAHTVAFEERLIPEDIVAIVTPLFHVAALNIMFQPAVLIGATSVFITPWSAEHFLKTAQSEKVTAAFMVPTQANALVTHPNLTDYDLSHWTKLSFAGAPMPDWVQTELMTQLPSLLLTQIYGQSEMGVVAALPPYLLPEKLGSVGRQPFNADVAIFRSDGTLADIGELGEVASRGDNMMTAYYDEPEQTREFFRLGDGWGLTGDIGVMDADGCITLIDRAKDMLISGGENVYPKEIEQVIYELDAVAECAVFGIPDDKFGELPAAYILLKANQSLSEANVLAICEKKLARHKRPRLIRFVQEFPKTAIGKIQKTELKAPYWKGRKQI